VRIRIAAGSALRSPARHASLTSRAVRLRHIATFVGILANVPDDERRTRLTADLTEALHRKLKMAAAARDVPVRDYLERLLAAAFDADPFVQAVETAREQQFDRQDRLRHRISARLDAAAAIENPEVRARVTSRGSQAIEDPFGDLQRAAAAFSAMSAVSIRKQLGEIPAEVTAGR